MAIKKSPYISDLPNLRCSQLCMVVVAIETETWISFYPHKVYLKPAAMSESSHLAPGKLLSSHS